jgi:hypothetical protein
MEALLLKVDRLMPEMLKELHTTFTVTRMPRIHALPPIMFGSKVMRSNSTMGNLLNCDYSPYEPWALSIIAHFPRCDTEEATNAWQIHHFGAITRQQPVTFLPPRPYTDCETPAPFATALAAGSPAVPHQGLDSICKHQQTVYATMLTALK